jgi:hypothetical protein
MARPTETMSTGASALGYLKSQDSTVCIELRLVPPEMSAFETLDLEQPGRKHRKAAKRVRKAQGDMSTKEVSLRLHQDLGTLSREQGDTGMFSGPVSH